MAKNAIQFQKSLSLHAFLRQYGIEEQCEQALSATFTRERPKGGQ